jgi:hypothetical protein
MSAAPTTRPAPRSARPAASGGSRTPPPGARGGASATDWRHTRAPPAAASTTGQVTASENHSPHSRISSSPASASSAMPEATCQLERAGSVRRSPLSAGISAHASP